MANYISKLIIRYFNNRHNLDIENKIQQWIIDETFTTNKNEALSEIWTQLGSTKADKNVFASLSAVNSKIWKNSSGNLYLKHKLPRVSAVLIPLLVIVTVWTILSLRIDTIEVITLAGEQKEIHLPDGSTVWLNSCSKVSYPERFSDTSRLISLTGEAYFSVVRNENKRFTVVIKDMTVMVLGTQFNVKAYPNDELITTTLTSGKVAIQLPEEIYALRPNQELVYNTADKSAVIQNVSDSSTNWRDGSLIFNNLTIYEMFKELERHFDVKIDYSAAILPLDKYSVKFIKKETLPQILNVLHDVTAGAFTFETNSKLIIITMK